VFVVLTIAPLSTGLAQTSNATLAQPKLEVFAKQGDYYWVVATDPDGTRRGGWISAHVIESINTQALVSSVPGSQTLTNPLPVPGQSAKTATTSQRVAVSATAPVFVRPDSGMTPLRVAKEGSVLNVVSTDGDWHRVQFNDPQLGLGTAYIQSKYVKPAESDYSQLPAVDLSVVEVRPTEPTVARTKVSASSAPTQEPIVTRAPESVPQDREGFWFSGGFGIGSLGCDNCSGRVNGFSGGLSLGATISERLLVGFGTTGWYRSEDGIWLNAGTWDARVRFYPSVSSGFFLTGGIGIGTISLGLSDFGSERETGMGLVLGVGWDIRVRENLSLTPFWNGAAVRTSNADANFGQLGLNITVH
jgi:hypothetical protein